MGLPHTNVMLCECVHCVQSFCNVLCRVLLSTYQLGLGTQLSVVLCNLNSLLFFYGLLLLQKEPSLRRYTSLWT